ncbi:OCIA domain-containing protein 2 [Anomaloglossus baeobatrachus]|uniref:OCIA domain-containing protein 2 n=1 Tax=Anomaloglossus baeobatrachus TaxID=238106 RepID=UPI003F500C2E
MSADPQVPDQGASPAPEKKSPVHCPITSHGHREEFGKIIKECKQESFWYRALPLSLTSMLATQILIHQGYLSKNKRFGSLPKLALAGFLGFTIGKISYFGTCQKKFEKLGVQNPFEAGFTPGVVGAFGPGFFNRQHKHCHHTCEECKKKCAKDKEQSPQPPTADSS